MIAQAERLSRPRSPLRAVCATPSTLMVATWGMAVAAYLLGPIAYFDRPRPSTWLFIAASLFTFVAASEIGYRVRPRKPCAPAAPRETRWTVDEVIRAAACVGLLGTVALSVDKLILSGLDYSQGVTAVRTERAEAVMAGTALELRRSPLLYIGFLTFGLSVPAYLLYLLRPNRVRPSTLRLAHAGLLSPVAFSLIYGGRSPMGLLLLMVVGAAVVRHLQGRPALPRDALPRLLLALFAVVMAVYSSYIFTERRRGTPLVGYDELEQHFENAYAAVPSPTIGQLVREGADEQLVMNALMTIYYVTHELPMLDRTLSYPGPLGPYHGQYQFYLVTALLARVIPEWSVDQRMTDELRDADLYGWFSTAWGGMYMDFGTAGAMAATFFCGWLSGCVYGRGRRTGDVRWQLFMCFVVAGILVSPALSVFTISISLPILGSMAITAAALTWPAARVPPRGSLRNRGARTRAGTPAPRSGAVLAPTTIARAR